MSDQTVVSLVEPRVVPEVVRLLERLIADAQAGRITGLVFFSNGPTEVNRGSAGDWDGPSALYAFELWKQRFLEAQRGELWSV
mgnify:CR=1 FL=1